MEENCLFCKIRSFEYFKNIKIFENEYFFSIFDINPVSPRHALVIPKDYTVSLLDLDKEQ